MTTNGYRHRLDCLEGQLAPPASDEEAERWQTAWREAARAMLETIAPVHLQGMAADQEQHGHPARHRPWGRLRCEVLSRIGYKVGHYACAAPWYPDSPLALVPAVAEAILDGPPNLHSDGLRCEACGYLIPSAGDLAGVERDDDGGWHYRDSGERCAEPALPDVAVAERSMWRSITLFTACPLCGCSELVSTVKDLPV